MSDNPNIDLTPETELPGYGVVALKGADCAAFAQSQFMNDVSHLADGQWQWNGWLNPKGRVRALFALVRLDGETFWLVGTSDAATLADELSRFRFRSKLQIDALPCRASGRLQRPREAQGSTAFPDTSGALEFDLSGDAGERTLRIEPAANADDTAPTHVTDVSRLWWAQDLAHGWPAVPGAALDAWTPQQLSLDRLGAYSVKKGCYPGQEIVARTHFLGRAKRGLRRIDGAGVCVGATVSKVAGEAIGTVICAAGSSGLAVLSLDLDETTPLQAGGIACTGVALQGGLQR